ncbi:hypothetical protein GQ457_10G004860 [Hibiscus cannabinus]
MLFSTPNGAFSLLEIFTGDSNRRQPSLIGEDFWIGELLCSVDVCFSLHFSSGIFPPVTLPWTLTLFSLGCLWFFLLRGFGCLIYSKLLSDALREAISTIIAQSNEKQQKFTETTELQIGLNNYDPQNVKHFSGSVKLPHSTIEDEDLHAWRCSTPIRLTVLFSFVAVS